MSPKREDAAEKILDAAESLFLSHGYSGTSMRDIARAAGYRSVAGLYNHFTDKETLFEALLIARSPYDEIFEILQNIPTDHAANYLPQLFETLAVFMQDHINFLQLVLLDFLEFDAAHMQALITDRSQQIMPIVARLGGLPGLRADIPPLILIRLVAIQLFGYTLTQNILPAAILDAHPPQEWRAHVQNLLMRGLIEEDNDHA
ncbi:MAG: TetR/AcrR family transcriptional regulator [Anaerolineales bacterium]